MTSSNVQECRLRLHRDVAWRSRAASSRATASSTPRSKASAPRDAKRQQAWKFGLSHSVCSVSRSRDGVQHELQREPGRGATTWRAWRTSQASCSQSCCKRWSSASARYERVCAGPRLAGERIEKRVSTHAPKAAGMSLACSMACAQEKPSQYRYRAQDVAGQQERTMFLRERASKGQRLAFSSRKRARR